MRRSRWMASTLPIALVVVLAAGTMSQVSAQEVRLEAELVATTADPLASGKAKFEYRADRTRFSTEVEDVNIDGQGRVTVTRTTTMDDGTVMVDVIQDDAITIVGGVGDLNLDTRDTQTVNAMQSDDVVKVFNNNDDKILEGTLAPKD